MDAGELLLDMATKLGVSPAFLSGVENGKRKIPANWPSRIQALYGLGEQDAARLREAFFDSNNTVEIDLNEVSGKRRNLALALARDLNTLPGCDVDKILKVLEKGNAR